ncbi:asparagine synthase (glutamine-hydrolyzing) [Hyunsoonleella flava]|uniref:asparagine synthase (glutamine-hydrolyzing) n=1 Tax=Hyunsoonleella flava TaxID=2527939 RepID=A0A4Q9FJN9_9FLAO|nr:asparagine synthase (glutamine-hydrolyzing) [Hyunsoonleella flava]TBN06524.1 asparagine synthase (glutamine-hydrolyzing) [Hyunsoonleella flava]
MCGIYLTNIPTISDSEVSEKLKSINYRGPDNLGVLKKDSLKLGHLRLSILDLDSRSNQPMKYDDLYITYNGEIYNYKKIKEELQELGYKFNTTSDTEVLLIGYKHWGTELLDKINGMFAFCIYNFNTQKIFCVRDRLGVKPFYYYWENGNLEICSQMRPLATGKKINKEAISIFLDTGYIPSPYSALKNVMKLPPGNFMEIDLNLKTLHVKEYWNLKKVKKTNKSYEDAKNEVHELIKDAVKIRLQSDVPLGSFLSGGIDSAIVSSIASEALDEPLNTFSIGFEDPEYDESKVAEQYAEIIKSNHKTTICSPDDILKLLPKLIEVYDEPFADNSALPSLLISSIAKEHVTVVLSGDGGDESFIGYNYFVWLKNFVWIFNFPKWIRKLASQPTLLKIAGKNSSASLDALNTDSKNDLLIKMFTGFNSIQLERNFNWMKHYQGFKTWSKDLIQKAADLNIKLWLENDSNAKVDRASMAYSLEIRSPFLDYRIIELARTLPINYRYRKGIRKKILRDILSEYIPESVFDQPKRGFSIPLHDWIRTDLKDEIIETLNDEFLNKVPNLNIVKFKEQLNYHLENKQDHTANIWKLFILGKWYKEFNF